MMTLRQSVFAVCGLALGLASCGDDATGSGADAGAADGGSEMALRCPDNISELFVGATTGTQATGKLEIAKARVIDASPVPPLVKSSENTWTVQLTDMNGVPLENAAIAQACLFMPVHQHGLPISADYVTETQAGEFQIENMYFAMRGPWEVQLAVSSPADAGSGTEFTDCDRNKRHPANELIKLLICLADD